MRIETLSCDDFEMSGMKWVEPSTQRGHCYSCHKDWIDDGAYADPLEIEPETRHGKPSQLRAIVCCGYSGPTRADWARAVKWKRRSLRNAEQRNAAIDTLLGTQKPPEAS